MSKPQNILVVGAGVGGPAVCYWLKHYGFSPTLIESASQLRKGGFAIDIRGIAVDIAQKMGIYNQVAARRTRILSGQYVDGRGQVLFEEQGETFGFRQGDDVEILRGDLIDILIASLEDVPCRLGCSIKTIESRDDKIEVQFNDGESASFDLVIGADGLHSFIRQEVFNAFDVELYNLGAYLCVFDIPNYLHLKHSEILFESNQRLVHVNSDSDPSCARAGFMFRSDYQFKNMRDPHEQKALLNALFYNLGWESNTLLELMRTCDDFYFDSITQVKMKHWNKGRVVLLGDAGFCASPLSGQGTSLALVAGYILAGELHHAQGNIERAFANYQNILTPFVDANQAFGEWVSQSFLQPEPLTQASAKQRTQTIMEKMQAISNAIALPSY